MFVHTCRLHFTLIGFVSKHTLPVRDSDGTAKVVVGAGLIVEPQALVVVLIIRICIWVGTSIHAQRYLLDVVRAAVRDT